jgi:hypothetical protein
MTSEERHKARYERRKAARDAARQARLSKYDSFDRVCDINSLIRANFDARKGVMWKSSVARYNAHFYRNAVKTHYDLMAGKNIHSGYYAFSIIERGKKRNIHSLHYNERVIRRSACTTALVPILSNNLIYDNGASLKGKGVSFSSDRCETHLHEYFRANGSNEGYILIMDFKKYFDNIHHSPLFEIIDRYITDPQLNALTKGFISSADLEKPPEERGKGLYIGPEDSQIYAVAYPNRIDHLIKDKWRIRAYNRYMDDSYIIHRDKETLVKIRDALFVEYAKLGIIPNEKKTQIIKLSRGFTFLKTKYFLTETGKVIRKADHASIVRERRKLKKLKRFYDNGEMTLKQIEQSYMSWRGYILQKDAYRSVESMDELFFTLFGTKPWKYKKPKRRKKKNGRQNRVNPGRNQRPEIVAC